MVQIVCLANSYKHNGRCIAGIDLKTGSWIRPISKKASSIYDERYIDGKHGNEPTLLDMLEFDIEDTGPDEGCQPENRYLKSGQWNKIGHLSTKEIKRYVENDKNLLHNCDAKVDPDIFKSISTSSWKSLQLVEISSPNFYLNPWKKHKCSFTYSGHNFDLKVTDPIIIEKINSNKKISKNCFFTISMATPFKTPQYEKEYCWKMVAGVIELM